MLESINKENKVNSVQVPDGSSSDISRVIRSDYADDDYLQIARKAYMEWRQSPRYKGIFYPVPYILTGAGNPYGESWIAKTKKAPTNRELPWTKLEDAAAAKRKYPVLSGKLATPKFSVYYSEDAGWADASKTVSQLRDDCLELDISFVCGRTGTVSGVETDPGCTIRGVKTLSGSMIQGDHFIVTAGAWVTGLVPMYNSTLVTAQVVGYILVTECEMQKYKDLPIYSNFSTG